MKKLLFMLVLGTVTTTAAVANGDGIESSLNNDKDKGKRKAKAAAASTTRLEEFIWTLPQSPKSADKVEDGDMQKAIVQLYKWYLKNETTLANSTVMQPASGDMAAAPFKVDPKILSQYIQFIKKNFPGLNENDLNDKPATATVVKKPAPVTYRDDIEAPITVSPKK